MVVEVIPGLLLGSMSDVIALLGGRMPSNISHLLSILNNPIDWSDIKTPQGTLMAKYISAPDLPSSDLLQHFPSCVEFIDDCISTENKRILVHCEHGMSRSATIVLAYLMKKKRMTFTDSLAFLKDKKSDIRPNLGFQEQLKLWQIMDYKLDNSHKLYRAYILHHEARAMKRNGYARSMQLAPNPSSVQSSQSTDKSVLYKCKKCRHVLLSGDSVLQHEVGVGESAFHNYRHGDSSVRYFVLSDARKDLVKGCNQEEDLTNQEDRHLTCKEEDTTKGFDDGSNSTSDNKDKDLSSSSDNESGSNVLRELSALRSKVSSIQIQSTLCDTHPMCSSLFVEPVEWMGPFLLGHKDGKLSCPKCSSRIGSFDWSGSQCSCGRWITPAFKIVKSKVDPISC